ncbi:MAG: hypothetical protein A3E21_09460 [Sulfurimonas sp. RIFCSPHIGHO2_12_FULL_36_9]|uniref:hypothetical protein n=1 Tax=Sulfurimonas sp. RIFCSPLOWO2_12_36_12 TaxID=1802253 RepID=UPI0008C7517A|nr:hypothetical protein [Sulfurimonas sp. RIFCSPLOWO2_12_36_12]OHD96727.1 MAG: hypothetical protein A3E21_09460 [Sulfurimonas sp. RIFCSPHIGHO2_12_FULL_36_9]OHE00285.1 MAG: hypothetical protein A3J26_06690 [Sulfurimonas sp. RIFCSPLOWO2_02_FULL_36_28]OHE02104.1 MAG: hypothetical protein A2W82_05315 [Sulfurimonas sp. RIFCSPLOWO2_12_36_12]
MAINKEEEMNAIFDTFKEESVEDSESKADAVAAAADSGSVLTDLYNAFVHTMSIEISGLKIGAWLILLLISVIISWFVWRVINKVKEHGDKTLFEKAKNYINKAGDLERRTLPFSLFAILIFLLFIEASGFSYVFSQLMVDDASESMLHYAMIFGGFVVSIVLMFLTHYSGEELHRNSVLKSIDNEMASMASDIIFQDKNSYPRNKISLEHTYSDDDAKTVVIPQFNRMHQKYFDWKNLQTVRKSYISIFTLILILSIGVGAMFVRFYVFEQNVDHYQDSIVKEASSFDIKTELYEEQSKGETKVNNTNPNLPSFFTEQSKLRDKYQRSSKVEAEKKASYVTYMVMMMLFFGIQVVGLIVGSRYSFVGNESVKAYKILKSYKEA